MSAGGTNSPDHASNADWSAYATAYDLLSRHNPEYKALIFVEQSLRVRTGESLLLYFRRTQSHMIPPDVEFWELPRDSDEVEIFGSIADGR